MNFKANDGSNHSSQQKAYQASQKTAASPDSSQDSQPKDITQDPKAMQLVDQLKQMGYTGEDVEQAMGGDQPQDQGQQATSAAPMQIPGM
jgi:Holliday junction resolvasome RuvABC DNA-binding subunit